MKNEVYNAAPAAGSGVYANVSATAKASLPGPQTQASLIQAKIDIHSLVTTKFIKVQDNMHLLLGSPNRQFDSPVASANGNATQYHSFDTLQILATKLQ